MSVRLQPSVHQELSTLVIHGPVADKRDLHAHSQPRCWIRVYVASRHCSRLSDQPSVCGEGRTSPRGVTAGGRRPACALALSSGTLLLWNQVQGMRTDPAATQRACCSGVRPPVGCSASVATSCGADGRGPPHATRTLIMVRWTSRLSHQATTSLATKGGTTSSAAPCRMRTGHRTCTSRSHCASPDQARRQRQVLVNMAMPAMQRGLLCSFPNPALLSAALACI
jgi:hypothetical protein